MHGENDETVNTFSGRESSRWSPICAAVSPATIPGRSVVRTYSLLFVGFRCCPKQLVRVWRGPQRWDSLPLSGLFYCCSCWVFVYILWCGDSENNLAIVSHYLQEVLNELTSEGQRLFFLRCHEFPSFFYVLLPQWWYKGCLSFRRNLFFFCGKKHILHILHLPPPTQRPKCNVLELRYGRISPEATSNSSSLFLFAVFLCYYRQNSCIIHSMDYMIVISRLFINLMTFFPTISFYGSLGNIWPYTVDLFRCWVSGVVSRRFVTVKCI